MMMRTPAGPLAGGVAAAVVMVMAVQVWGGDVMMEMCRLQRPTSAWGAGRLFLVKATRTDMFGIVASATVWASGAHTATGYFQPTTVSADTLDANMLSCWRPRASFVTL